MSILEAIKEHFEEVTNMKSILKIEKESDPLQKLIYYFKKYNVIKIIK